MYVEIFWKGWRGENKKNMKYIILFNLYASLINFFVQTPDKSGRTPLHDAMSLELCMDSENLQVILIVFCSVNYISSFFYFFLPFFIFIFIFLFLFCFVCVVLFCFVLILFFCFCFVLFCFVFVFLFLFLFLFVFVFVFVFVFFCYYFCLVDTVIYYLTYFAGSKTTGR